MGSDFVLVEYCATKRRNLQKVHAGASGLIFADRNRNFCRAHHFGGNAAIDTPVEGLEPQSFEQRIGAYRTAVELGQDGGKARSQIGRRVRIGGRVHGSTLKLGMGVPGWPRTLGARAYCRSSKGYVLGQDKISLSFRKRAIAFQFSKL